MPWPQTVDYNAAIQDPRHCFADPELAGAVVVEGMIPGIPLSWSGNFASVYKVQSASAAWAVKCFTRKVENLTLRYKQISDHLERHKRRFIVEFQYLEEGIHVGGAWYPVVKMQWVEGLTFNEFLREQLGNLGLLEQLCQLWLRMGSEMRASAMAHGDLQHGNVMLVPGSSAGSMLFRLVDYDGMWVPSLAELPSNEVGHPNYQHPRRLLEGGYSADIDRFAHLAIYTGLRCLMAGGKALWAAHDNQENLLFRAADFKSPERSKLFAELIELPDPAARSLAGHLLLASRGPLDQVPLVSDLLARGSVAPLTAEQWDQVRALVHPGAAAAKEPWFADVTVESPASATSPEMPAATAPTVTEQPIVPDPMGLVPLEQRRAAAELYARANDVIAQNSNYAYAQQLLLSSCKLDPTNLEHRKMLRDVGRAMSGKRGGLLGSLTNLPARGRLRTARNAGDHRKVLEYGEELLARQPGDVPAQIEMAEAAEALGMPILAVWLLKEARQQAPTDLVILRALARLCERLERYAAAVAIWHQVHQLTPSDMEAATKIKELAAWDAIARAASLV